jgi:hypothetical protein
MQVRCLCPCHSEHRADQREANHASRYMEAYHHAQAASVAEYKGLGASVSDPLEAAVACADCLHAHCPALSSKAPRGPRIIRVTPPFNPNSDSQQVNKPDDGEGAE